MTKMPKFTQRINFTIDEESRLMLLALCAHHRRSVSNLIRYLITQEFRRLGLHL